MSSDFEPDTTSRFSPTLEGYRIAFRRPALVFAEIIWRWSVGASACLLLAFGSIDYLDSLPVSKLDADILATRQAPLIWRALAHIFHGSLNRATLAMLFVVVALSLLWITAASLGRLAIVRVVLAHHRSRASKLSSDVPNSSESPSNGSRAFRSLIGLNCLRAVGALAALLALMGAAIVSRFSSAHAKPQPTLQFLIFAMLALFTAFIWVAVNWLLSFSSVFVVRNGEDALGAICAAVDLLSQRWGSVFAVGIWNAVAHFAAFTVAGGVASFLLLFISVVPARLVVLAISLVALLYFAVVDWLFIARLAGYVCIAEAPETFSPSSSPATPALPGGENTVGTPPQTAVDRDEPILSDVPGMTLQLASHS
jgi:hypothetical protein